MKKDVDIQSEETSVTGTAISSRSRFTISHTHAHKAREPTSLIQRRD